MHYRQNVHSRSISRARTRYKDCLNAQGEHIRRSGLLAKQSPAVWKVFRAHIGSAHRQPCLLCANTELSSPPLLCAWMNKFRQNYIEMHVLANILVNSRLRKACLNVKSGERKGMCISQGRSHGCARVCRCHPQWQLAHLKTDAEYFFF